MVCKFLKLFTSVLLTFSLKGAKSRFTTLLESEKNFNKVN